MRTDSKNLRHNLSLSDILVASSLKLKVFEKENETPNLETWNENSDDFPHKKKSGLHKSQVIRNKNFSIKDVDTRDIQSELIVQKNKQNEDNKAFENRVRHAVGLLIKKLQKNQNNLKNLQIEYQRAKRLIKILEDKNLTQKKALKIYRNELKARDINIKLIDPQLLHLSNSDI